MKFHGEESKWYAWSFQTRAYVAASKIFEAKYLREAEKKSDPITIGVPSAGSSNEDECEQCGKRS